MMGNDVPGVKWTVREHANSAQKRLNCCEATALTTAPPCRPLFNLFIYLNFVSMSCSKHHPTLDSLHATMMSYAAMETKETHTKNRKCYRKSWLYCRTRHLQYYRQKSPLNTKTGYTSSALYSRQLSNP